MYLLLRRCCRSRTLSRSKASRPASADLVFAGAEVSARNILSRFLALTLDRPGVNVVLTSGNSHRRAAEVTAFFLPKPYRVAEAARCIRSLLEDPQQGVDEGDPPR
jgi:hypothetical protein